MSLKASYFEKYLSTKHHLKHNSTIDSNTSSISLSLVTVSASEFK